eukprot:8125068-Alexandrium_andersonii.AAC.1
MCIRDRSSSASSARTRVRGRAGSPLVPIAGPGLRAPLRAQVRAARSRAAAGSARKSGTGQLS